MNKKLIKILLVDDDPADRKLTEIALKSGLQTVTFAFEIAENLEQGLKCIREKPIDLVLLDLGLPDSKGIVNVEKVRQAFPNLPTVVITGLADEDAAAEAVRKGAIDYITKPFTPTGLRTRIGIALQIIELQQKLTMLANTDELTGLANRRAFFDILEREILRSRISGSDLAVIMIDIDHFKSANDTYGHHGGDEILQQLGKVLKENIYPLDVAARYGGEEFVILIPSTSSVKAAQAAVRLRKIIDQHQWKVSDQAISITASIGFVSVDAYNLINAYDIVEKADAALYTAKRRGRNCVVSWDEVNTGREQEQSENEMYQELQKKLSTLSRQLQSHVIGTISALTRTMEIVIKEPYLAHHGENVRIYSSAIAQEMALSNELCERIGIAAMLQDIGKISIPHSILKKQLPLTEEEQNIIQQHPLTAAKILEPIGIFSLELQIIKSHHERFDGTGYPNRLKGREIPIGARILALADAFDAMTSQRCYRPAKSADKALEEIKISSGSQFDPDVVDAFQKVYQKHKDDWPPAPHKSELSLSNAK